MISQDTINKVNDACNIVEVVSQFVELKKNGANYVGLSPFTQEKTPSFTVSPSKNIYKDFSSGKGGDCINFLMEAKQMTYIDAIKHLAEKYKIEVVEENSYVAKSHFVRPIFKNNTMLSENVVKWFEGRGISQKTLTVLKVGEGNEWMPQNQCEVKTVQFHYFIDGVLINTKFRSKTKGFKLVKDAELVFYNLDAIKNEDIVIITEGEIDCLAMHEAGYINVISVPNGATKGTQNLKYLDNCYHLLENKKEFWLAVDNDENGNNLRDELARRLGFERCYKVFFEGFKDANDCLIAKGVNGIIEGCNARKEYPIEGVFSSYDIESEINDYYHKGLPKGDNILVEDFDNLLRFHKGYITTITGIPGHGKSEFVDFLMTKLSTIHKWKFGIYSPENHPLQLHFSKFAEKLIGKPFTGKDKMNLSELNLAKKYFADNFYFIKPKENFTLDNILVSVKSLILRHGINAFVIDAWNKIEHNYDNNETKYISIQLDKLSLFCEANNVHLFLVAHPTKINKDKNTGNFEVPNLYSISGSANFNNKTSNGITVHIDRSTGKSNIHVQKVKFKHWGHVGMCELNWSKSNGRYYSYHEDLSNWITKEGQQQNVFEQPPPTDWNNTNNDDVPF